MAARPHPWAPGPGIWFLQATPLHTGRPCSICQCTLTGIKQHFRISHKKASPLFHRAARFPAAVLSCFIIVRFNRLSTGFAASLNFLPFFGLHRASLFENPFFQKSLTKAVLSGIIVWRYGVQPTWKRWLSWFMAHAPEIV